MADNLIDDAKLAVEDAGPQADRDEMPDLHVDQIEPVVIQTIVDEDATKLEYKYESLGHMDKESESKQQSTISSPILHVESSRDGGDGAISHQPDANTTTDQDIIDKIKTCQMTNKEIINYVLNMLVDGEFDMEKNFVIRNHHALRFV
jgi:hypothetical protein